MAPWDVQTPRHTTPTPSNLKWKWYKHIALHTTVTPCKTISPFLRFQFTRTPTTHTHIPDSHLQEWKFRVENTYCSLGRIERYRRGEWDFSEHTHTLVFANKIFARAQVHIYNKYFDHQPHSQYVPAPTSPAHIYTSYESDRVYSLNGSQLSYVM